MFAPVASALTEVYFQECQLALDVGWSRRAECAELEVPLDYSKPEGKSIRLSIVRIPARQSRAELDPMLMLAGGPGQAASEGYLFADHRYNKLAASRDLYLIDQRGTGRSNALRCPSDEYDLPSAHDFEQVKQFTGECLATLGGDVRFYTTSVAIRDFEFARKRLGIAQWNLLGTSYGTRVAQHYLREHPEAIRSVVLDSVVPATLNLGPAIALESQRALEQVFERCKNTPECNQAFPNLSAKTDNLIQRLKAAPISLSFEDANTGKMVERDFTLDHLLGLLRLSLYRDGNIALLPLWITDAEKGHYSPMARNAFELVDAMSKSIAMGMHNTVMCTEDVPFFNEKDADTIELTTSYMGENQYKVMIDICKLWPTGPIDKHFKEPVRSDKPVLLLSGEIDPITPPSYADMAMAQLANARHVVFPGQGHSVSTEGCGPDLVAKFVEKASVAGLPVSCVDDLKSLPFFLNYNGPVAMPASAQEH